MYGTVARFRVKPEARGIVLERLRAFEAVKPPGAVATYVYRTDADADEYYLAVVFENRAMYMANADSAEQDARYRRLAEVFEGEPEWHDGEIVFAAS